MSVLLRAENCSRPERLAVRGGYRQLPAVPYPQCCMRRCGPSDRNFKVSKTSPAVTQMCSLITSSTNLCYPAHSAARLSAPTAFTFDRPDAKVECHLEVIEVI